MGQIFFLLLMISTAVASLARPWIGVVGAYVIVILRPQAVWWWNFDGLRPALYVMLPTLIGFGIAALRGRIDFGMLNNKRALFIFLLWGFVTLSYVAGPYVDAGGPYRFTDPAWAFSTFNKIFLLYFIAALCIDSLPKLKALVGVIIVAAFVLIYWANAQYLGGNVYGRMAGPTTLSGTGSYADQNNFAMFFVVALPFLWFYGLSLKNVYLKWTMWLAIPFGWHAIFLTGSRGGLVGVAVTLMLIVWRSRNKAFGILIIPAFVIAYMWQAGDLMRERATTISEYETESSATGRLNAWGTAINMMKQHPVTGVGLASFGPAYPDHSDTKPREAHNTFFQISGESGVFAGLMYLSIVGSCLLALWRNGKHMRKKHDADYSEPIFWINEAALVSFSGLIVCSLFLSLQMFEIFYYLAVIVNAIVFLYAKELAPVSEPQDDVAARRQRGRIQSRTPVRVGQGARGNRRARQAD